MDEVIRVSAAAADMRILASIREWCEELFRVGRTYGNSFAVFDENESYRRSVASCLENIGRTARALTEKYRLGSAFDWRAVIAMEDLADCVEMELMRDMVWQTLETDIARIAKHCDAELVARAS